MVTTNILPKLTVLLVKYEYIHRTEIVIIRHIAIGNGIFILDLIINSSKERPYKMDAPTHISTDFNVSFKPLSSINIGTNIT